MSVREDVKDRITFFTHNENYLEGRTKWRAMMRSYRTAEKNIMNPTRKRRKRRANTSASKNEGEGTG